MEKIKEAIKQIWNRCNGSAEKNIWILLGYSDGECPLTQSFNRFVQSYPHSSDRDILDIEENTSNAKSGNTSKTTKPAKTPKADKRRLMVDKIRRIKNVCFKGRIDKKLWWGDCDGACPAGQHLRVTNLHSKDFLKTFLRKESQQQPQFNNNQNFCSFPTIVTLAEIEAARRQKQEFKRMQQIRFLRHIRSMKK